MNDIQTLKGFRDFLPKEAKKRQYVIGVLRLVFESFGFEPLETPTLEYEKILMGKYGDEADKLLYRFTDNGDRRVAMRYDQTVPLARVVAQYQNEIPNPFKRYQVQPVWRAENTQRGRFREFLQCDIDTVGSDSPLADAEILAVIAQAFTKLGFTDFRILVNDRSLFKDLKSDAIIAIDKIKKIGAEKVKEELVSKGYPETLLEEIQNQKPTANLEEIITIASEMGVPEDLIVFEPTLARGLDYYTGMIIEIEIPSYTVGSVGGGGRYNNLVGMFAERQIPAVGFAFGFDRIMEAMDGQNLFPATLGNDTKVLVTIFSSDLVQKSLSIYKELQEKNIPVEIYLDTTKMEKQLKYANQKGIPYVIIIGSEEAEKDVVTLKNMQTREQKQISRDQLPDELS